MMYLLVPDAVFQAEHKRFPNCSKPKSTSEDEVMKPISDSKITSNSSEEMSKEKRTSRFSCSCQHPTFISKVHGGPAAGEVCKSGSHAQRSDILSKESNFHNYLLSLTLCSTKAAGLFLVLKCYEENIA